MHNSSLARIPQYEDNNSPPGQPSPPTTQATQYRASTPPPPQLPASTIAAPAATVVEEVIIQLLHDRPDAPSILVAATSRLGVFIQSYMPGLVMDQDDSTNFSAADRVPDHINLRDALSKWHAWAASRRRIIDLSRQIRRLQSSPSPKVTRVSTWSERDANARADALSLTSSSVATEPEGLPFATAEDLPPELQSSKHHSVISRLLNSRVDLTLNRWRRRSLYTDENWAEWAHWQSHSRTHRDANESGRVFSDRQAMLIAPGLRSANPETAADAWNEYRRHLLIELRTALTVGFPWSDILRRLHATLSDPEHGYQRLANYIAAACEDRVLLRHPLLHADILIYQLDVSYATGSRKYANDSCTIDWERATSRLPGEDTISLAVRVVNAYLVKSNDPKLSDVTVWDYPSFAHDINLRYAECLENDEANFDRGDALAREFRHHLYNLQAKREESLAAPADLSCERIAQLHLFGYESAHYSDTSTSEHPLPPAPSVPRLTHTHSHKTGSGARARRDARRATEDRLPPSAYMPDHLDHE